MKKNIIIVLAIGVPILLGIYLYRKNKRPKKSGLNTGVRRVNKGKEVNKLRQPNQQEIESKLSRIQTGGMATGNLKSIFEV